MFADAIPRLRALQARPVDFSNTPHYYVDDGTALHSARRRAREDEYECGTDILRDVLYRRRTRQAAPRRPFTRTARHHREDADGNVPTGNGAWFRKWNVTSYEEYYALREPSFYVEHPHALTS